MGALAATPAAAEPRPQATAADGVLDLRSWDFVRDGPAHLRGEWSICWDALLTPDRSVCPLGWTTIAVPRLWSEAGTVGAPDDGRGVATYRLRIRLPEDAPPLAVRAGAPFTAHEIWIDGGHRGAEGRVSRSAEESVAVMRNRVYALDYGQREIELLIQLSNHEFRGGGLRRQWVLGTPDQIQNWVSRVIVSYGAFGAVSVVIGLIYLVQFALRPSERVRGYFGLAALTVGVRVAVSTGTDLSQLMFPSQSFAANIRVDYFTTNVMVFCGAGYFAAKLRDEIPIAWTRAIQLAAASIGGVALLAPFPWTLETLRPTMALALVAIATAFFGYLVAIRRAKPYVRSNFVALCFFAAAAVHDVVRVETGIGAPLELFSFFMVVWLVTEAWSMSRSFTRSFATIESLSEDLMASNRELRATNAAVKRFVPYEFLERLDKRSIAEVERGDHVEADMNVMFCDIRAFTGLVAGMGSEEAFGFINGFLRRMEPVIHRHGGFVNQYLGDCIMALFPAEGDAALQAGIEMTSALRSMNGENGDGSPEKDVGMGIGVNAGSLMLGTIGGTERLSGGVIGDAVNLAARTESLTKVYGAPFVVTAQTVASLRDPGRFSLRELDRVVIQGRRDPVSIHEVIDALDDAERAARRSNLEAFGAAGDHYRAGDLAQARRGFEACLARDPDDRAAELWLDRCRGTESEPEPWGSARDRMGR